MNKKIVFFDVDGTLVNVQGTISESTREALRLLKENGHLVFVCTGRTKAMFQKKIAELGFDGYVFGGGTHIEYQGNDLYYSEIEFQDLQGTIDLLHKYKAIFTLEGRDYLYVENGNEQNESSHFRDFIKSLKKVVRYIDKLEEVHASKMTCIFPSKDRLSELSQAFQDQYNVIIHENNEADVLTDGLVELVPMHCNKATGIQKCIEYLNISLDDTYAVGDSNNDLEMLAFVQNSICMGNGSQSAKEVSSYITGSIDENGVYDALKHFGLI